MFKSDVMNALVACNLVDQGYDLNETLDRIDSFTLLLQDLFHLI